jgi:hypothetical protein
MKKTFMPTMAQPGSQVAITQTTKRPAHAGELIGSVFVLATQPLSGIWFPRGGPGASQPGQRWTMRDGTVQWEPCTPLNASERTARIAPLAVVARQKREDHTFLKISRTSTTPYTWSLPAIASCPVRDETCQFCYALSGRFAAKLHDQIDRVLRLEYLKKLIDEDRLDKWIAWMVAKVQALRPREPFNATEGGKALGDTASTLGRVPYMRWHDSGDIFCAEYGRAILEVCAATPEVLHYLPTRMGTLVKSLVEGGCAIPPNLAIQVSVHKGGHREPEQLHAVRDILEIQPSARIGVSYFLTGQGQWAGETETIQTMFRGRAVACPLRKDKAPKDRVCAGCRHCWASSCDRPVIFVSTR